MNTLLLLLLFLSIADGLKDVSFVHCRGTSKCVTVKTCQQYMDLLEKLERPLRPSVVQFLRAQQCGFVEGYPKVCCSNLPKNLNVLKDGASRRRFNKLSTFDLFDDAMETTTRKATTRRPFRKTTTSRNDLKDKADAFNRAFSLGYLDFGGYDLFTRRRRSWGNETIDIEVR